MRIHKRLPLILAALAAAFLLVPGHLQATKAKVNLNAATQQELEALPGVGEATARKIIAGRPYASVDDLAKAGVPAGTIEKIRSQVTAKPASAKAKEVKPKPAEKTSAKEDSAAAPEKPTKAGKSEKAAPAPTVATESKPASASSSSRSPAPASASAPAAGPAPASAAPASGSSAAPASTAVTAQTPPVKGMVWVNINTKVYHYEGDRWYGKTKNGKFMTEDDAVKAGFRASKEGPKSQ